jgi:hypothetical protein
MLELPLFSPDPNVQLVASMGIPALYGGYKSKDAPLNTLAGMGIGALGSYVPHKLLSLAANASHDPLTKGLLNIAQPPLTLLGGMLATKAIPKEKVSYLSPKFPHSSSLLHKSLLNHLTTPAPKEKFAGEKKDIKAHEVMLWAFNDELEKISMEKKGALVPLGAPVVQWALPMLASSALGSLVMEGATELVNRGLWGQKRSPSEIAQSAALWTALGMGTGTLGRFARKPLTNIIAGYGPMTQKALKAGKSPWGRTIARKLKDFAGFLEGGIASKLPGGRTGGRMTANPFRTTGANQRILQAGGKSLIPKTLANLTPKYLKHLAGLASMGAMGAAITPAIMDMESGPDVPKGMKGLPPTEWDALSRMSPSEISSLPAFN